LRFTSFAVASLREDFHLQECARAGRTKKTPQSGVKGVRRRTFTTQNSGARFYSSLWISGNISSINLW